MFAIIGSNSFDFGYNIGTWSRRFACNKLHHRQLTQNCKCWHRNGAQYLCWIVGDTLQLPPLKSPFEDRMMASVFQEARWPRFTNCKDCYQDNTTEPFSKLKGASKRFDRLPQFKIEMLGSMCHCRMCGNRSEYYWPKFTAFFKVIKSKNIRLWISTQNICHYQCTCDNVRKRKGFRCHNP